MLATAWSGRVVPVTKLCVSHWLIEAPLPQKVYNLWPKIPIHCPHYSFFILSPSLLSDFTTANKPGRFSF